MTSPLPEDPRTETEPEGSGRSRPRSEAPARPVALVWATVLMVLICVLSIVFGSSVLGRGLRHVIESDRVSGITIIVFSSVALLAVVLVWFGAGWARYALAALLLANLFAGLFTGAGPTGLAGVLATGLMFLPTSNQWFRDLRYIARQRR